MVAGARAQARAAAGGAREGALHDRARGGPQRAAQRALRRRLSGGGLGDAAGELRERRDQLARPAYARPELLASRVNEVWSWDITKLKGLATWSYYYPVSYTHLRAHE